MDRSEITGTGFKQRVNNFENKYPEFDPRTGEHCWIVVGMWRIDPEKWTDPNGEETHLDIENLLAIDGPGCYFCEKTYKQVKNRRCKGHG